MLPAIVSSTVALWVHSQVSAQPVPGGVCKLVSKRTTEVGCRILANEPVGQLTQSQIFWHLDVYPTLAAAEAAKGPRGTVVESLGRVWLLSIEETGWRPVGGRRVAEIGPLPIMAGREHSAQYMEAIFTPGMTATAHTHSGPEAWYTLAGETCLETPQGKQVGRAGGHHVIVPGGRAKLRVITGKGAYIFPAPLTQVAANVIHALLN